MKRLPVLVFILFCFIYGLKFADRTQALTNPQDGSTSVGASVNNPTGTPTPTSNPSLTGTPTPTLGRGVTPTVTPKGGGVGLSPTPGKGEDIYLDISGFASPHASIVMTSNDVFIRAAVADANGNFYISQIKIASGFSKFCLENIDFQKIGDSLTCFEIPPVTSSTAKKNIFLPPSLGLSSKKTTPTTFIYGFGYTMPGSKVSLQISEGVDLNATADQKGYFKIKVENLAVGKYQLFATANYQGKNSEKPSKTQELSSLSQAQIAREKFFTSIWELIKKYDWLIIPILILIFILLSKKARDKIKTFVKKGKDRFPKGSKKEGKHLHHFYFLGY